MSDYVIPHPKLHSDCLRSGPDPDRVSQDIAALTDLTANGVAIDGQVQVAESTWVIYGHTSYDGEIIVGEYHDAAEAAEVLRRAPRVEPNYAGPVPGTVRSTAPLRRSVTTALSSTTPTKGSS